MYILQLVTKMQLIHSSKHLHLHELYPNCLGSILLQYLVQFATIPSISGFYQLMFSYVP
jgi:hypothetical protein